MSLAADRLAGRIARTEANEAESSEIFNDHITTQSQYVRWLALLAQLKSMYFIMRGDMTDWTLIRSAELAGSIDGQVFDTVRTDTE